MGWVALLLAFAIGVAAATTLSVLGFMAALSTAFVLGGGAFILVSDSVSRAVWETLAAFVSGQIGYVFGLAALARLDRHRGPVRGDASRTIPRWHFRVRK